MNFTYVIAESVEVSDNDFEEMIKYLRVNPDSDYKDAIYTVLENTYDNDAIEKVIKEVIEELKKKDIIDKRQGNVYLTLYDCEEVNDFFKLMDKVAKRTNGERSSLEIIYKLFETYNSDKNTFDEYRDEVMKIEF